METIGQVIRMPNLRLGYTAICRAIAEHGEKVSPRGQDTREFQCATLIIDDPYDTLPTGIGRGLVPGIAAIESAQLLAGVSLPKLTIAVSPTFEHFTEDDGIFHGAYGPRTQEFSQFSTIVDRLKMDPYSRQTVVSIWNPMYDMKPSKRDYPCTVLYHFMIRDDHLHMETVMRSNDVILGLGYDAFQHSRVQIAIASVLGVELGEYRHHVMSLHLYERDLDKVDALTAPDGKPEFFPAITGDAWSSVQNQALDVLRDADQFRHNGDKPLADYDDPNLEWYASSMIKAIERNRKTT